jgi:hypothetical protein
MFFARTVSTKLLPAAALLGILILSMTVSAESPATRATRTEPVEAQFRGCETAGWCRFWIEPRHPSEERLHRVRPDGVLQMHGDDVISIAVRDRMNALLASMIHQHKQIILHDLRELGDGTFAAAVTVNGANLASDPILVELRANVTGTAR